MLKTGLFTRYKELHFKLFRIIMNNSIFIKNNSE